LRTLLRAAITMDVDTLESIYKGQGCMRPGGYSHAEMRVGFENFTRFIEPYKIKATLFMVGNDFRYPENLGSIKAIARNGHEIANHTMTHAQGFRLLSPQEKENEISGMEEICEKTIGRRPVGFRSPGWNIGDDAMPILQRRAYLYDSSIFPTSITPLLKILHCYTMRSRSRMERTTLGRIKYMLAPVYPYRASKGDFTKRGDDGIIEFPVTVTPVIRLPFFATFLVSTGMGVFMTSYRSIINRKQPLQFQFHLSDFVDYNHRDLVDQVPEDGKGVYVPYALRMPLEKKLNLFRQVMDTLTRDYEFVTLKEWSKYIQ
jgi:hypothetical protein